MSDESRPTGIRGDEPRQPPTVTLVRSPKDAISCRVRLIDQAQSTLDVQYYEWASDLIGTFLLDRMLRAADRGVKVRLLVDDLRMRQRTKSLAALCQHPNLEVRLYNPWRHRSNAVVHAYEFARRFRQLDRRMHNKLLIADRREAIVGGRNIADPHFGLHSVMNLVDFDLFVTGSPVVELDSVFRSYWVSEGAVRDDTETDLGGLLSFREDLESRIAAQSDWNSDLARIASDQSDAQTHQPGVDAVKVVADDPTPTETPRQVHDVLRRTAERARRSLTIVTPFFVLGPKDIDWYTGLMNRGIDVQVLTNSLASNPGTIANSGYRKGRSALLDAGVDLYELRSDASAKHEWEIPPASARLIGLHGKLYIIDRRIVILGSPNLDPRSRRINTEMALTVTSEAFASGPLAVIDELMSPSNAWAVKATPSGALSWVSDAGTLERQPSRGTWQRVADGIAGRLPIGDHL